jgi:hypothetical protein
MKLSPELLLGTAHVWSHELMFNDQVVFFFLAAL